MSAHSEGFTLIEMLATLLIVAVLFSVSLPLYERHIETTERKGAEMSILMLANRLEDYFAQYHTYQNATLGSLHLNDKTEDGAYDLAIDNTNLSDYLISAAPNFSDTLCGTLSLNEKGDESAQFQGVNCW